MTQIRLGIEAVELGRTDETVEAGYALGPFTLVFAYLITPRQS